MEMHNKSDVETVLAFDFGLKQIGIAFGQTITNQSTGIKIIKAKNGVPNWDEIKIIVEEWNPDILVVGFPIHMNDKESEMSALARNFAKNLKSRSHINVKMVDERLSSREAKNKAREASKSLDTTKTDHIAAALILQSFLNNPKSSENV